MSADIQDFLREEMTQIAEHVTVPAGLGLRAHDRWRRRRRSRRHALAAAAAAATAAGAIAGTVSAAGPASSASPAAARTTAYVVRKVARALAAVTSGNLVEYARTTLPPGTGAPVSPVVQGGSDSPRYTRPVFVQGYYRGLTALSFYARPGSEIFRARAAVTHGRMTTTWVTFTARSWWHETRSVPVMPPSVWCSKYGGAPQPGSADWSLVDRQLISCRYTTARPAPGLVDGQHAIELRQPATAADAHVAWTLWVSRRTYLPLRLVVVYGRLGPDRTTFRWLPPTRANLAPFSLTIPPHFRQVRVPVG
jgi:hypothetical protein